MATYYQSYVSIQLLILLIFQCTTTTTVAQSPAVAPAPPGPTNITKILEKAGQFTTLIRLFGITQVGDQINTQLNNSNQGMTVFAPTDNAFSGLKAGTLNSLSDQQKVALIQFHVIPNFLSTSQLQTVSNPVRTQAGDSTSNKFPLNITSSGNQVNISTGVDDATVGSVLYTDGSLAVYPLDKVLLPMSMFGPSSPAPAPAPAKKKKSGTDDITPSSDDGSASADSSGAVNFGRYLAAGSVGAILFVATFYL